MGTREISVMDQTGHTKHIWDSEKAAEVNAAKDLFDSLTKKGYKAYHVRDNGEEGSVMKSFDKDAEKMILQPPIVGG
jgi:hypothetical protein